MIEEPAAFMTSSEVKALLKKEKDKDVGSPTTQGASGGSFTGSGTGSPSQPGERPRAYVCMIDIDLKLPYPAEIAVKPYPIR